jgi:cell wall-associated NlpC family hydrolase
MMIPDYTDLLGKPFAYHGRGPDAYDCWGLVREICGRGGVDLPDHASSAEPAEQSAGIQDDAAKYYRKVDCPEPLDVILFQVVPRYVTHCGVYVGYGRFVHITEKTSVACEELASLIWVNKIRGFYRFRGGNK